MRKVNENILNEISLEASDSSRKRKNLNFHSKDSDPLQRLLNALEPSTYVRPHKHINPDKREVFILLRGKVAVIEFDEKGNIADHIILDHSSGNYAAEITPAAWHTVISFEENSVYYEVKDGPYDAATDKIFAEWSPEENSIEKDSYLQKLKKQLCSV